MEFFRFCMEIIQREAKRFNVGISASTASQLTAANADDFNYDNAHNRCSYLYKCGTINLAFARDCFSKFLSEYNGIDYLQSKWRFEKHLTFCSISKGPALDYISLLLSHEQCRIFTSQIKSIRIIAKNGAWRNTANIMLEVVNEGYFANLPPSIADIEVIQGDPFDKFTEKVRLPVSDSNIVMMIKTLNLQSDRYDQTKISKAIQELLEALKPGAVLFCIDTKPSIKEITQILSAISGKYLLSPSNMNTAIDLKYIDSYKDYFGCLPVISGRGCFLVWEKLANEENSAASTTFDIRNNSLLIADGVNSFFQKENIFPQSNSLISESVSSSNQSRDRSLSMSLNSLKFQLDSISNNICMQSESEQFSKGTEVTKIAELTSKITDLTVELTKLLENNALKHCPDNCSRNLEELCSPSDKEVGNCAYSECSQNCRSCCCHQKCVCHQSYLSSNHNSSCVAMCDEASNYSKLNSVASGRSNILAENTTPSTAQLVIPLNNLSADVVSQIISLITSPNHES